MDLSNLTVQHSIKLSACMMRFVRQCRQASCACKAGQGDQLRAASTKGWSRGQACTARPPVQIKIKPVISATVGPDPHPERLQAASKAGPVSRASGRQRVASLLQSRPIRPLLLPPASMRAKSCPGCMGLIVSMGSRSTCPAASADPGQGSAKDRVVPSGRMQKKTSGV